MSFFYIAFGGALGSIARYMVSTWGEQILVFVKFPIGTLIVNLVGCLLAGILAGWGEKYQLLSNEARLFVLTGLMGGFTTFSAFGLETVQLLRRGDWTIALIYVLTSVFLGIGLLGLGFYVSQKI